MATKTERTEITQQKKVFVKSEEALDEMEANGQLEPFTDYYTDSEDDSDVLKNYLPLSGGVLTGEVRRNHNLFDFSNVKLHNLSNGSISFDYENKTIAMTSSAKDQYSTIYWTRLKPNTQYTMSCKCSVTNYEVYIYVPATGFITQGTKCTFTTDSGGDFNIRIDNNTAGVTAVFSEFMLNEGAVALPYDKYFGEAVYKRQMADAFAPSGTYEDLGTSSDFYYTPLANGYIAFKGVSGTNLGAFAVVDDENNGFEEVFGLQGLGQQRIVPVRKGVKYHIVYSNIATSHSWGFYIRFYYSQGEL